MSDTPRTDRAKWTIKDHYSGSGQSEVVCASVAETLETENATLHAANDKLLNEGIELLHDKTAEIETLRARIKELTEWRPITDAKKEHGKRILCRDKDGFVFEAECEFDDGWGWWCSIGGDDPIEFRAIPAPKEGDRAPEARERPQAEGVVVR